ncbi:hypothetical protein C6499_13110 [Candidatus Poribacteria bacterium]|nr:MAG: hypothetical protein C6499_13110 [Candidatus Poribacteria bacterium]
MKDLIVRRLTLSVFMTLILVLTFSVTNIMDAQVPDIIVPQKIESQTSKASHENDTVPVAARFNIAISEIMYVTNTDKLPQWIELHNRSGRKVSLEGWEVTIMNHPADKSVLATTLIFTLGAEILDRNQVLLLVTERGPNSGVGTAKGDIQADRVVILKDLIGGTPGYRLLSQTAFKIILTAPAISKTAHRRKRLSDIVGNLGEIPAWKLPLIEGNQRSSLIRAYEGNNATGRAYDGTAADGWELTGKKGAQYTTPHTTYYGHHSDHSTPGYRALAPMPVERSPLLVERSPLPVELSKFRPERKRSSSEVVIRWITESETNNAGFNILRSENRDGEFTKLRFVAGQGTTSERTLYEWTDKTAKPNVVYYYQLECVSVDGTRQTLRMSRLRGNIGRSRHPVDPFWWRNLNQ